MVAYLEEQPNLEIPPKLMGLIGVRPVLEEVY